MIHKNIHISGRVQGVGFRFSARNAARQYGIKGYVKNMSDGSVYIEAEGNEQHVEQFVEWCKRGPSHAYVEDITVNDDNVKGFSVFDIDF